LTFTARQKRKPQPKLPTIVEQLRSLPPSEKVATTRESRGGLVLGPIHCAGRRPGSRVTATGDCNSAVREGGAFCPNHPQRKLLKMSRYSWVRCPAGYQGHPTPPGDLNPDYYTSRLFNVGILDDGTLHNPNGYPEEVVRAAILAGEERRHERRSQAAKAAAETRRNRQRATVYIVARRAVADQSTGPRQRCYVCGRRLEDSKSVARGIGSECWQDVLRAIAELRHDALSGAAARASLPKRTGAGRG
jgi:Family of unknown function (DUF6011)